MPQIFKRSTNAIARITIFGALFFLGAAIWVIALLDRSAYSSREGLILAQPVPFSHNHHVSQIGIDCRYCHTSVETSAIAGMPATEICMNCHKQIWADSPMLEPVRSSFRTDESLRWSRVHDLPDHVYFDHSVHVAKGVGCVSCHGQVDKMPLVWKAESLKMEWCLDCHRNPAPHLRPKDQVFNMAWTSDGAAGEELFERYDVAGERQLTSCSTCHR